MTDDQAAMCVLLTATAALKKRVDKTKTKAALTLRIVGSCVSASAGYEMDNRMKSIVAGQLVGDLTGGDRSVCLDAAFVCRLGGTSVKAV